MSQENVDVVRRVIEASGRGDVDVVLSLLSSDFVYRPIATFTDTQERRGLDGFRRHINEFREAWGDDFAMHAETIREYGDALVALTRFTGHARASGIEISGGVFQVYRFRDGQIARVEEFTDRNDALKAAGLEE
jgi:ketosteroid isomerase-like protein